MAQSFVRVPPDSTGKLIDTWVTAVAGQHRQGICIADPSIDANVIPISSRLRLPVELEQQLDLDTGGGTSLVSLFGIALPGAGGPVLGGTSTNPLTVNANAGTNLNTSALATEAGNLASILAVEGATNGAAVITDANGTIQQYLRGLVKLATTAGSFLVTAAISAGSNLIGDVGIQPRAANGLTTLNSSSSDGGTALTNNAQAIKASAGLLYGYYIYNPNAAAAFVQFYNTAAASVTVGTTNPLFMLTIPPLAAVNIINPLGITFSNAGWSWAATSTAGGNGALGTALDAIVWYN